MIRNRLKDFRKRAGLTLRAVSERIGVPLTTYQSWERGVCYPPLDKAYMIAEIYGSTIEELWMLGEDREGT